MRGGILSNHSEAGPCGDSEGCALHPSSFVGGNRGGGNGGVWFLPCSGGVGRFKEGLLLLDPGFEREDRSRIARVVGLVLGP